MCDPKIDGKLEPPERNRDGKGKLEGCKWRARQKKKLICGSLFVVEIFEQIEQRLLFALKHHLRARQGTLLKLEPTVHSILPPRLSFLPTVPSRLTPAKWNQRLRARGRGSGVPI
jgi:hypothetical protein